MAIIENRSTEIGDVIHIKAEVPIIGLIALTGFIDQTQGENSDRFFLKEFRYSTDGFNWSQWKELTIINVAAVQVTPINTFYVEYKYSRKGTLISGTLAFDNVELQGEVQDIPCGKIFDQSVFAQLINCHQLDVLQWCINVLEKLYSRGIVPNYIERSKGASTLDEDADYLTFWRTVSCFFALFVIYARQFENISSNETLLLEYVLERGIFLCSNADTSSLNHFREYYYDEIRRRGTVLIAKPAGYGNLTVNGELLRLICWQDYDELIFALLEPQKIGWNVGNSSPLYKGIEDISMMVKGYELSRNVVDLDNYGLTNESYCNAMIDGDGGDRSVLTISDVPAGEISGIFEREMTINPYLDYEISFLIKQVDLDENLTVKILAKDFLGNSKLLRIYPNGSLSNVCCERIQMLRNDIYYQVRFFIYGLWTNSQKESLPNIHQGNHLRITDTSIIKLIPQIYLDNTLGVTSSGLTMLWDVKFRPLRTPGIEENGKKGYSLGFIHSNNFIEMYALNRNVLQENKKVEQIVRDYLIPYDSTINHNWLPKPNLT